MIGGHVTRTASPFELEHANLPVNPLVIVAFNRTTIWDVYIRCPFPAFAAKKQHNTVLAILLLSLELSSAHRVVRLFKRCQNMLALQYAS